MDENTKKSRTAVAHVMRLWRNKGYRPRNVSNNAGWKGCDLYVETPKATIRMEVKGVEESRFHKYKGAIPDCHETEFDEDKRFVADYLYIVRVEKCGERYLPVALHELTKEDVDKYWNSHREKKTIVVSSYLKRALYEGLVGKVFSRGELM